MYKNFLPLKIFLVGFFIFFFILFFIFFFQERQDFADGNVLRLGVVLEPPHLDPTEGAAAATDEIVYANIFEGLTRIDRHGDVQALLATRWSVSSDGLTWRFYLKKNVQFHDGTSFDASDAVFSLDRARDPKGRNAQKKLFESIASISTLDPHQLSIKLKYPDASLLYHLGWGDAVMVAPESAARNKITPVGTGPFIFDRWRSADRIALKRYRQYHGKKPSLDEVVFYFIPDPATASAVLKTNAIDVFPNFPAPESVHFFEKNPKFNVVVGVTEGETILAFNHKNPILKNKKIRQALTHAINRQDIIDGAMFGYGEIIGSHFSPAHEAYVDLKNLYPYDIVKAKQLLEEAGYSDGFRLRLALPPPSYARRSGEIIASQLLKIGVTVDIIPMEWPVWLERVFQKSNYDMSIVAHTEPDDIDIYARKPYYFNYDNSLFNVVVSDLQKISTPSFRKKLYASAQRILAEDAVNVFLFQLPKIGISSNRVDGLWENSPLQANDVTEVVISPN